MALDYEQLRDHVEEKSGSSSSVGETTLRLDADVVQRGKEEAGVSQNTQYAPLVEALILDSLDEDEEAEERMEQFKDQFED